MDNDPRFSGIPQPINCKQVEDLVDAYIDEEMSPSLINIFETHLAKCSECKELVDDCVNITNLARTLDNDPLPMDVTTRLREALREQIVPGPNNKKLTLIK